MSFLASRLSFVILLKFFLGDGTNTPSSSLHHSAIKYSCANSLNPIPFSFAASLTSFIEPNHPGTCQQHATHFGQVQLESFLLGIIKHFKIFGVNFPNNLFGLQRIKPIIRGNMSPFIRMRQIISHS